MSLTPSEQALLKRQVAKDRSPWIWVEFVPNSGLERYHVWCYDHVPPALRDSQPPTFPMTIDPYESRLKCWGCQIKAVEPH